jgi:hypothetical protein
MLQPQGLGSEMGTDYQPDAPIGLRNDRGELRQIAVEKKFGLPKDSILGILPARRSRVGG